tara:strand:+ start:2112 stop:2741 length:630 start_codon:yes stop_codon:yes gene_type:complete
MNNLKLHYHRDETNNLVANQDGLYDNHELKNIIKSLKQKETQAYSFKEVKKDNSVYEISEHLQREYTLATLTTEMRMHKARQTRMDNDVQRYFNSTPLRNAFARWMTYGYLVNKPYNITTLCDEMVADRKTVSIMIKECSDAGWVQTIKSNGQLFCLASPILVDKVYDYILWRRRLTKDTIGKAFVALKTFEDLMSIDTTNNDTYSTDL